MKTEIYFCDLCLGEIRYKNWVRIDDKTDLHTHCASEYIKWIKNNPEKVEENKRIARDLENQKRME